MKPGLFFFFYVRGDWRRRGWLFIKVTISSVCEGRFPSKVSLLEAAWPPTGKQKAETWLAPGAPDVSTAPSSCDLLPSHL